MIDLYHSRRNHFKKCEYYAREEGANVDLEKYILNKKPVGIFYAKPSQLITNSHNQINNAFIFDKDTIVIETNDNIENIKAGFVVKYNGFLWFVESVQIKLHNKETQFEKGTHGTFYLSLRK